MNTSIEVWGLWDADELISVHLTGQDATDAREQHLDRYRAFHDEQDAIAAVEICRTHLIDPTTANDHEFARANATDVGGQRW